MKPKTPLGIAQHDWAWSGRDYEALHPHESVDRVSECSGCRIIARIERQAFLMGRENGRRFMVPASYAQHRGHCAVYIDVRPMQDLNTRTTRACTCGLWTYLSPNDPDRHAP